MALKKFNELYAVDISSEVKKKPTFKRDAGKYVKMPEKYWLDYLEWATVVVLLHKHGAESVTYGSLRNPDGYPVFGDRNGKNPFVSIWVEIDGKRFEIDFPVIDGNKAEQEPDQLTIHKAQQRAFVKAVAINTGLGLKLWQKEETTFDEIEKQKTKPKFPDDNEKFKKTVEWLKGKGTIEKLKETFDLDEELEFKLIAAAEL